MSNKNIEGVAVAYTRSATNNKEGIKKQEAIIKKFAKENNIEIKATFSEIISGEAWKERAELHKALNYMNRNKIAILLVADKERISRNPSLLFNIQNLLAQNGMVIAPVKAVGEIDLLTNDLITSCLREHEKEMLSKRIKAGIARKKKGVTSCYRQKR